MKVVLGEHTEEFADLSQRLQSVFNELHYTLEYYQDEDSFVAEYVAFMERSGRETPEQLVLFMGGFCFTLYSLFIAVAAHGGFSAVCTQKYCKFIQ